MVYPVQAFDNAHAEMAVSRVKGGQPCLLNAPPDAKATGKAIGAFGIPFDCGMFINQGCNKAPLVARQFSHLYCASRYPFDEIYPLDQVFDGGNLLPEDPSASVHDCLLSLRAQIKEKLTAGQFRPIFIGGDHTLPYATIAALSEHLGKPLSVIHIDAHPDINNTGGNEVVDFIDDSTFLYDLLKKGYIDPERTVQMYLRQDVYNHEENEFLAQVEAIDSMTMKSLYLKDGFVSLVAGIAEKMGSEPVYITFDIDAMDMAYAPGTTYPMPGGATADEITRLFLEFSKTDMNFYGGEVVEVIPDLDTPTKITCLMALTIMRDMAILAWKASRKHG